VPSFAKLKEWSKQHGIQFTSNEEIIKNSMVLALYEDAVSEYNQLFNQVEQVKKFTLMSREWGIAYDEMTPKMSIKRKVILSHFEKEIEAMYV
jgi:long-chain acyl-CoA synthetase